LILADTSIWVDHLHRGVERMRNLLDAEEVILHPYVVGELALGTLRNRRLVLDSLADLPEAIIASRDEVLDFIEAAPLFGAGIGYVDAHLLVSTRLMPRVRLWTKDKRLRRVAEMVGVAAEFA
jgi:predicted nucleic acid-binding protein